MASDREKATFYSISLIAVIHVCIQTCLQPISCIPHVGLGSDVGCQEVPQAL